jgi:hypothetical protein
VTPCLGPDEFVDLLEGQLPAARAAHVEACPACRERFAWLQGTLRDVIDAPVPEPSPLFWDHLAARVRRAVDGEAAPHAPGRWWQLPVLAPALGLAALVATLVATIGRVPTTLGDPAPRRAADLAKAVAGGPGDTLADVEVPDVTTAIGPLAVPEVPIDVVTTLVAGLDWDDLSAAGLTVAPGVADAAIEALAADERAALVRALQAALAGPES